MKSISFRKKYHVAVVDSDPGFVHRMVEALKEWYSNRVIVQSYTSHDQMFVDLNLAKCSKKPFDMAVMKPEELPTSMILRRAMPSLKVVMCEDLQNLKRQTVGVLG
jgi:hypothetical protein